MNAFIVIGKDEIEHVVVDTFDFGDRKGDDPEQRLLRSWPRSREREAFLFLAGQNADAQAWYSMRQVVIVDQATFDAVVEKAFQEAAALREEDAKEDAEVE